MTRLLHECTTSIAPLSSSNRARLYPRVHTLHETTGTNGTRSGIVTPDRSTARHFLAHAQLGTRVSQAECRGFESLCPLWWGWLEGVWWWLGCGKPRRGEVGALLARGPRSLQLTQPDCRPSASAVHSNTSVAACFAARSRSVIWRCLGAICSIG